MIKQIIAIVALNMKGIRERPFPAIVTIVGIASMVGVMTALLALGAGLLASGTKNISSNMVVVVAKGAASDYLGSISRASANIVAEAPGVRKDSQGNPVVTPKIALIVNVTNKTDHRLANTALVGLPVQGFGRDGARLTKGRVFRSGMRELVVGRVASKQFENLGIGEQIMLRGNNWTVVGEYEAGGATSENSLAADADTVLSSFGRTGYQEISVELEAPSSFNSFKSALANDPRLSVDVFNQKLYTEGRLSQITSILNFVGYFIGAIMALGAFFGVLNMMHSAISSRMREIATLRAVGFRSSVVLLSLALESLILAIPGALIGVGLAAILFEGSLGQVGNLAFPIQITPSIVTVGIIWTLIVGLIGGLVPSFRAVRLPIAIALRTA